MRQISAPSAEALEAFLRSHVEALEAQSRISEQASHKAEALRLGNAARIETEAGNPDAARELREDSEKALAEWNKLGEEIAADYPGHPVFQFAAEGYAIGEALKLQPNEVLARLQSERFLACYYAAQHGAPTTEAERADFDVRARTLRSDSMRYGSLASELEREAEALGSRADFDAENAKASEAVTMRKAARETEAEALALEALAKLPLPPAPVKAARIVRRVEVESHGVDHAQYFPGAGVCLTEFDDCATGVGNSEREALADALESLAQSGEWEFQPENGYPAEPSEEDYSEVDSVSEAEAEARSECASVPDAIYCVRLYPFNGCGPIDLARELESRESALESVREILERKRSEGFEVSEVEPFKQWEAILPGQGVGDSEGIVTLEVSNAREIERAEEALEAFDDTPSELSYYVTVRVSDTPESIGESYGLAEFRTEDGSEYLYAADYDAAETAAQLSARESLWACSLDFLAPFFPANVRGSDTLEALAKAQETLCESFGPIVEALLGDKLADALREAVRADGPEHFLATYDSQSVRDSDGSYRFRVS